MTDWFLALVVVAPMSLGAGMTTTPSTPLVIRLPERTHCEAVRQFLLDLDALPRVPERLRVGDCRAGDQSDER